MKIVIAFDSFKGCISSIQGGMAARGSVMLANPGADVRVVGTADGGEGTLEVLHRHLGGEMIKSEVCDPFYGKSVGFFLLLPDGNTAVAEMAEACGLARVGGRKLNVMKSSSNGFGTLIRAAADRGVRKIVCTLGGSNTNDCGIGALQALGLRVILRNGEIAGRPLAGEDLEQIAGFDTGGLMSFRSGREFEFLYDGEIDFCGEHGAVAMYARQKGADDSEILALERGMVNVREKILRATGIDPQSVPGGGAAGGCGGGLACFLGARGVSGADYVLDAAGFDRIVEGADLVITGEGQSDRQTLQGKAPLRVLERAMRLNGPDTKVALVSGKIDGKEDFLSAGFWELREVDEMDPVLAQRKIAAIVGELVRKRRI